MSNCKNCENWGQFAILFVFIIDDVKNAIEGEVRQYREMQLSLRAKRGNPIRKKYANFFLLLHYVRSENSLYEIATLRSQ